jgi:hypothetical protein
MRLPVARDAVAFFVALAMLGVAGYALGAVVGRHPKLETFKLLNIAGLTYDLLGLLVLAEFVVEREKLKSLVVSWVAGTVLWSQSVVPLAAALGAWAAAPAPSSAIAASFFFKFWAYSLAVLAFIDSTVFFPRAVQFQELTGRARRFGLTLLISGVAVQLLAAFKDLYA